MLSAIPLHTQPDPLGSPGMISVDFVEFNPPSIGRYRIDPFPYVVASAPLSREEILFSSLAFALDCGRIETKYLASKEGKVLKVL